MKEIEEEIIYEDKMDQITDHLEGLVLDAILSVLKNLKGKNDLFYLKAPNKNTDEMKF